MKNQPIYLILAIMLILSLTSCCDVEPQEYYFSGDPNVYNFKVSNVFKSTFLSNKGGTHSFNNIVYKDEMLADGDCKECCDKFQTVKVVYDDPDITFNFSIDIEAYKASAGSALSVYFDPKGSFNLLYPNEKFAYIERESLQRVLQNKNSYSTLLDSVTIVDKVFYNVFKFQKNLNSTKLYPKEIFYTKEQGIVGYLMSDSTLYRLQN